MSKKIIKITFALIGFSLIWSCSSLRPSDSTIDQPNWYKSPPQSSTLVYGVGSAKMSTENLSRDTAISRARKDIAMKSSTTVNGVLISYAREESVDKNSETIDFIERISKSIADIDLSYAITEKVYVAVDGKWYALVSFSKEDFLKQVNQIFSEDKNGSFTNFNIKEAQNRVKKSIDL